MNSFLLRASRADSGIKTFSTEFNDLLLWYLKRNPALKVNASFQFVAESSKLFLSYLLNSGLLSSGKSFGSGGNSSYSQSLGGKTIDINTTTHRFMLEEREDPAVVKSVLEAAKKTSTKAWNSVKSSGPLHFKRNKLTVIPHAGITICLQDQELPSSVGLFAAGLTVILEARELKVSTKFWNFQ
jgi:hypothetical protein